MEPVRYFSNISQRGPVKYRDVPGSIGVLEARDTHMPIGEAHCKKWDENGLAVWVLSIGSQRIEGRWIVVDHRFEPIS